MSYSVLTNDYAICRVSLVTWFSRSKLTLAGALKCLFTSGVSGWTFLFSNDLDVINEFAGVVNIVNNTVELRADDKLSKREFLAVGGWTIYVASSRDLIDGFPDLYLLNKNDIVQIFLEDEKLKSVTAIIQAYADNESLILCAKKPHPLFDYIKSSARA